MLFDKNNNNTELHLLWRSWQENLAHSNTLTHIKQGKYEDAERDDRACYQHECPLMIAMISSRWAAQVREWQLHPEADTRGKDPQWNTPSCCGSWHPAGSLIILYVQLNDLSEFFKRSLMEYRRVLVPAVRPSLVSAHGVCIKAVASYKYLSIVIDENPLNHTLMLKLGFFFMNRSCFTFTARKRLAAATLLPPWIMVTSFIREPLFTLFIFGFCLIYNWL